MNDRKPRKALYLLCLAGLLCVGLLAVCVGTAYARYRDERQVGVTFQVREPETVRLGTVLDGVFTPADTLQWAVSDGAAKLEFTVANGESAESYSARDQVAQLTMIGTLGILQDGKTPELSVTYLVQEGEQTQEKTAVGKATPIVEGTALYHSYGAGWVYRFYETVGDEERELTWELPGGQLSWVTLTVKTESELSGSLSLLQPLVSAESID